MAEEIKAGCARPTGGPVGAAEETDLSEHTETPKEEINIIQVGKKAPDSRLRDIIKTNSLT